MHLRIESNHTKGYFDGLNLVGPHELERAKKVLVNAFYTDPMIQELVKDDVQRIRFCDAYFSYELRAETNHGITLSTSKNFEGVSVWQPPGIEEPTYSALLHPRSYLLLMKVGVGMIRKLLDLESVINDVREKAVPEPHWYLKYLGVDPLYQGRGFGGKLLRPVLRICDKVGTKCYLFTQNEKNVNFYKHFGFQVNDDIHIPAQNQRLIGMIRLPGIRISESHHG
jgi:ribosomal protein S18 acetylase RimI-like enzyme